MSIFTTLGIINRGRKASFYRASMIKSEDGFKEAFKEFNKGIGQSIKIAPHPLVDAMKHTFDKECGFIEPSKKPKVYFEQNKDRSSKKKKVETPFSEEEKETVNAQTRNGCINDPDILETVSSMSEQDKKDVEADALKILRSNFKAKGYNVSDDQMNKVLNDLVIINKHLTCLYISRGLYLFSSNASQVLLDASYAIAEIDFSSSYKKVFGEDNKYLEVVKSLYYNNESFRKLYNKGLVMKTFVKNIDKWVNIKAASEQFIGKDNMLTKNLVLTRYKKSYNLSDEAAEILYGIHGVWWMLKGKQKDCGVSDEVLALFRETNFKEEAKKKVLLTVKESLMQHNKRLNEKGAETFASLIADKPVAREIATGEIILTDAVIDVVNSPNLSKRISDNDIKRIFGKYYDLNEEEAENMFNVFRDLKVSNQDFNKLYLEATIKNLEETIYSDDYMKDIEVSTIVSSECTELNVRQVQLIVSVVLNHIMKDHGDDTIKNFIAKYKDEIIAMKDGDNILHVTKILLNYEFGIKFDKKEESESTVETPEPKEPRVNPEIKEAVENGEPIKQSEKKTAKTGSNSSSSSKKAGTKKTTGGGTKSSAKSSSINKGDDDPNVFSGGSEE